MPEPKPPRRLHAVEALFGVPKPVVGTIHLNPLPGAPRYTGEAVAAIAERAVEDATRYRRAGLDALIVENEGDIPFLKPGQIGPETVAALAVVAQRVRESVSVPLGVLCLANAANESIAVAKAVGAEFVRVNQWANAYIANEGYIEGAAATALRFRSAIRAENVKVLADVHVKHGSHAVVADRSIAEMTHDVEAFDADILIATGQRTGDPTRAEEITAITDVATRGVLVGSGLTAGNAPELLALADGAIVGSAMKEEGNWWNPVSVERATAIMDVVRGLR